MQPRKLEGIDEVIVGPGGSYVQFRLTAEGGVTLDLRLDKDELTELITHFTHMASHAALSRTNGKPIPIPKPGPVAMNDVWATEIAVAAGEVPNNLSLVVRLSDFDLAYTFERAGLSKLRQTIDEVQETLAADEGKPN